ncbi:unnamed protein product [Ranitomeya imitator]|uniref:Heme-binding protein 1 n=1 Tax=Ranitomeya imitator TaxID=111125 RepID=A0ABN9LQP1_9NEOB|nr:unnamed protein product [Ranitomeya imitator]
MAEPIQQLTRSGRTEERQKVPFLLLSSKEKCGEVIYEKRQYGKAKWACIKMKEERYEQSICMGFMKLMRYICEQNSTGTYLGMTIPILTTVHTDELRTGLTRSVTVAYYIPNHLQDDPPEPTDQEIIIEEWPATIVFSSPISVGVTVSTYGQIDHEEVQLIPDFLFIFDFSKSGDSDSNADWAPES